MSKRSETSPELRFLLFWLLAGLCEAPVIALLLGWPPPLGGAAGALLHALAAVLIFLAPPRERGFFDPTRHWGEPMGALTFLLPGVGWAASGWLVLGHRRAHLAKEAYIFEDDSPENMNPLAGLGTAVSIQQEFADAHDVIPAVDALLSDVPGLRRGAIEALSRMQTTEAIGWILKARAESDPEIRFFATTALTRLKHDFELAIRAAEREVYQKPGELAPQIALQRTRYEYAISGMLDADSRRLLLEDCRRRLAPQAGRNPEILRLLYRVELELDRVRALPLIDELEPSSPVARARWIREKAELLFSMGRFHDLRAFLRAREGETAAASRPDSLNDRTWKSVVLWWAYD